MDAETKEIVFKCIRVFLITFVIVFVISSFILGGNLKYNKETFSDYVNVFIVYKIGVKTIFTVIVSFLVTGVFLKLRLAR